MNYTRYILRHADTRELIFTWDSLGPQTRRAVLSLYRSTIKRKNKIYKVNKPIYPAGKLELETENPIKQ